MHILTYAGEGSNIVLEGSAFQIVKGLAAPHNELAPITIDITTQRNQCQANVSLYFIQPVQYVHEERAPKTCIDLKG